MKGLALLEGMPQENQHYSGQYLAKIIFFKTGNWHLPQHPTYWLSRSALF